MKKIAILTDSNCGISPQEGKEQGIYILPMPVIIQEQIFYEGYEINEQQFYERLQNGNSVTTSQPSAGVVMESWERLLEHYGEVVYIPMSSSLSGSCQTAQLLAEEEPFRGRVHVVDNHRISVTQAQSVYDAKRMAKQGYSGEMIRKTLEKEAMNATIYITVDSLTYLKKGGRITTAASLLGTALNLKPILTIQGGKLDAYAKCRGMKTAFKKMCQALDAELEERFYELYKQGRLKAGIASTWMEPEKLAMFRQELKEHYPDMECIYMPLTMSIGAHIGPGGLGIGLVGVHAEK